jgi:site-specific DNA-methyltransferase (adenine-specific)
LWRESLRWLHYPGAGAGSTGTERFRERQGLAGMRHAKPVAWVRCMLGCATTGAVLDPFAGSGTTLLAAQALGRQAVGIELDRECCELAAARLAGTLGEDLARKRDNGRGQAWLFGDTDAG